MPYMAHGCNAYLAKEMKERVGGKVVIESIGAVNDPDMAEEQVRSGMTDLVGMGPLLHRRSRLGREGPRRT